MEKMQFGTLVVIKESGSDYICKCLRCKSTGVYRKYDLINGNIKHCRTCKKFSGVEMHKVNDAGLEVIGYKSSTEKEDDIDISCYCTKCGDKRYYTKIEYKQGKMCQACKERKSDRSKELEEYQKILKKSNIQLINRGEETPVTKMVDPETKSQVVPKSYAEHIKKLEGLEEQMLGDKGALNKDYVGRVFNGIEVLSQEKVGSRYWCVGKCISCGETYKAPLHKMISYRVNCMNCKDSRYTFMCPKCNSFSSRSSGRIGGGTLSSNKNSFTITREELYQGGVLECPVCDNSVSLASIAYNSDQTDMRNQVLNSIDTEKFGDFERIDSTSELVISSKPAYTGRDRKPRFNCYCLKCKKNVCLTAEETIGYDHTQCTEWYNGLVPLVKK